MSNVNCKCQMSIRLDLLSEHTSGVSPVIFEVCLSAECTKSNLHSGSDPYHLFCFCPSILPMILLVHFLLFLFIRALSEGEFGMRLELDEGGLRSCSGKGAPIPLSWFGYYNDKPKKPDFDTQPKVSPPIWDGRGGSRTETGPWWTWPCDVLCGWPAGGIFDNLVLSKFNFNF